MTDKTIWARCPKCKQGLGFSGQSGLQSNGLLHVRIKSRTKCGHCKTQIAAREKLKAGRSDSVVNVWLEARRFTSQGTEANQPPK